MTGILGLLPNLTHEIDLGMVPFCKGFLLQFSRLSAGLVGKTITVGNEWFIGHCH